MTACEVVPSATEQQRAADHVHGSRAPELGGALFYLHALAVEPGTSALSLTKLGDVLLR